MNFGYAIGRKLGSGHRQLLTLNLCLRFRRQCSTLIFFYKSDCSLDSTIKEDRIGEVIHTKGKPTLVEGFPATLNPIQLERVRSNGDQDLGPALCIDQVAKLLGCSAWTVRQTLMPRGLPHFRFNAGGRLVFYRSQVVRWIEREQQSR